MLEEIVSLVKSLDSKTKNNIACAYLTIVFLTLFLISIFLQESITFTKPIFLMTWSLMCLLNVVIYWSVISITDYMNLREEEEHGKK